MISPPTDLGAQVVADEGYAKPQTMSDATYINGAEIDRAGAAGTYYDSAVGIFNFAFTSSSGASGGKVTVTLQWYDDTATGMGTEATYGDAYTYEYTWAADGANSGVHVYPIELRGANRYVRLKAKQTKAGTITVSGATGSIAVVLSGMSIIPDAAHSDSGYESTTEAS
jgi:hypothetical protein